VTAGSGAAVAVVLERRTLELAPVVVTVAGQQDRQTIPNAIANINAAQLTETQQINNVGDLLVGKAAGVQLLSGSQVGAGQRIRIRGTSSLTLSNDPVVFVDGVRIDSRANAQVLGVGGAATGRLNDINPDDIENIDVIRGPSASALYGTDAANGVIVITTKRGRPGRAQINAYTVQGRATDPTKYPDAYTAFGKLVGGANAGTATDCTLVTVAAGTCAIDSVRTYNLFDDPRATPLTSGANRQYGLQVRGGSDVSTYFLSGDYETQEGTLTIPAFDRERLTRVGVPLRAQALNPNNNIRSSLRGNFQFQPSSRLQIPATFYYVNTNTRLQQDANNTTGLYSNALGGNGTPRRVTSAGDTLYGYRAFTPGDIFQNVNRSDIQRIIAGVNPTIAPASWLTLRGNGGLDFSSQTDDGTCLRDRCVNNGQTRLGFRNSTRSRAFTYTADASASAAFQPFPWLSTRTTPGAQYLETTIDRNGAFGTQLPPGGLTVTQASVQTADEATTVAKTASVFLEQNLQVRRVIDLVASVRGDQNSAFGVNFGTAYYPRLAGSYRIGQESWFPLQGSVSNLRLRAAWGRAGNRPGTTSALPFFGALSYRQSSNEVPGVAQQTLGNLDLRPETVREAEGGIDLGLFKDRFTAEVTYYNKRSINNILNRTLAPSIGNGQNTRAENLGGIKNVGWEYLLRAQPLQRTNFAVDLTLNGSQNSNKLISLGQVPPIIGTTVRQIAGYPVNGYWARNYTYSDANGDKIIAPSEIQQDTAFSFLGYSQPRTEISFQTGVDLFRYFRVSTLVDFKGGFRLENTTERFRCVSRNNARERIDPTAPLDRQARCAAALQTGALQNFAGYLEDASFTRFRELSVQARLPQAWLRRAGGLSSASVALAGRNLGVRTDYTGLDPETSVGQGNIQDDFQAPPPQRIWTVRISLGL
jgi:TonB-linked SusC/RagA family outer membrane protein